MKRYTHKEIPTIWVSLSPQGIALPVPFSHAILDTKGGNRPLAIAHSQAIAIQMTAMINKSVESKPRSADISKRKRQPR